MAMLTAKLSEQFDYLKVLPEHIKLSATAKIILKAENHSLPDNINVLLDNNCYQDATLLLSFALPIESDLRWAQWCQKNISHNTTNLSDSENPAVWLDAANFWFTQYSENHDAYLLDLGKEAITSAIILMASTSNTKHLTYIKILENGMSYFK